MGAPLPRISPEEAGVRAQWVQDMVGAYARRGLRIHSFLLVRGGRVYAEGYYSPYHPAQYQTVYSLSKSFTSVAMGLAEEEGILSLDERVLDLFAQEAQGIQAGPELQSLTLRHLLRMSTGQPEERWEGDFVRTFLGVPFVDMPGKTFRYNTMATYMCAAALHRRGVDLETYLQEKLFTPMGISGMHWMRTEAGICAGGFGLSILPEVIAKFGVLILQDGVWEGRQLLPRAYLRAATSKQIDNDGGSPYWRTGYGYQFWMCQNGSFRGDGMYGQLCVMNREKDAVLAMTAFVDDIQAELDVYFDEVLGRMQDAPLPPDPAAEERLRAALSGLVCPLEPVRDGGGEITAQLLNRPVSVLDGMLTLTPAPDGMLNVTSSYGHCVAARGELYGQRTLCRARGSARLDVVTEAYAGYGVAEGALVLRLLIPELMMDARLELRPDGNAVQAHVLDVHNPASPQPARE